MSRGSRAAVGGRPTDQPPIVRTPMAVSKKAPVNGPCRKRGSRWDAAAPAFRTATGKRAFRALASCRTLAKPFVVRIWWRRCTVWLGGRHCLTGIECRGADCQSAAAGYISSCEAHHEVRYSMASAVTGRGGRGGRGNPAGVCRRVPSAGFRRQRRRRQRRARPPCGACFQAVAQAGGGVVTIPPGDYFCRALTRAAGFAHHRVGLRARFHLPDEAGRQGARGSVCRRRT